MIEKKDGNGEKNSWEKGARQNINIARRAKWAREWPTITLVGHSRRDGSPHVKYSVFIVVLTC
jgi:hypothetical protein